MSKKKNKKFKKKSVSASSAYSAPHDPISLAKELVVSPTIASAKTKPTLEEEVAVLSADPRYSMVRKETRKVLLIMASLLVLLAVVYVAGLKTPYINQVGAWLYQIANIQVL